MSSLSPAFPARAPWGTADKLRAWQQHALSDYCATQPRDYLAVATPGAGKTTFALQVAAMLVAERTVQNVTVVCPTEHLKRQWADAASRVGIDLDPEFRNAQGAHSREYLGVVLTYAQVAMNPALHERRTSAATTLVILDEVHHAGDALSWGEATAQAFGAATRRLALTGTPFRSDTAAIPFVTYEPDAAGVRRSRADHSYGYADALRDGVVRPVLFLSYSGQMRWRTRAGSELSATLGEPLTKDVTAAAWRTALDPSGQWVRDVLAAADKRLTQVRRSMPDAGGMVIATDQKAARAYAGILREITGTAPVVVLSDDAGASDRIEQFAAGDMRWLVAVRMVSEGVDVPRLAVGVYATSAATPLFFAQVVGRFVRARRRGETASIFLPSIPQLLALAGELEVERDHALDRPRSGDDADAQWSPEEGLMARAQQVESASAELDGPGYQALDAQATFDRVLFDNQEFGTGSEIGGDQEQGFLLIPGLVESDDVRTLLRENQAKHTKRYSVTPTVAEPARHRQITALRKELHALVGAWAKRTGVPHAHVHAQLRQRCGGPEVAQAQATELQARIALVRDWLVGKPK